MNVIGRKITSLEVAEMVGKRHDNVMRDIKLIIEHINTESKNGLSTEKDEPNFGDNYSKGLPKNGESYNVGQLNFEPSYNVGQLNFEESCNEGQSKNGWSKIGPSYFEESYYVNSQNKKQPMYLLTKEGCELFGTRMTGAKGTQFALKYVQRFNEMERESLIKQFNLPTNFKEALLLLAEQEEQKEKLQLTIEEQKPKVAFAESLLSSETNILIRDFVKILKNKGINTGEKRLFEYLRSNGYLITNNYPSQYSSERGWFSVTARTITNEKGTKTVYTTRVTPKGQEYFLNKLLKDGI